MDANSDGESCQLTKSQHANYNKPMFFIWTIVATSFMGTKMMLIGLSRMNKFWIYIFEHVAIFFTGILLFMIVSYNKRPKLKDNEESENFFKYLVNRAKETLHERRIILCCMISGACDTLGNLLIIFTNKFAHAANVSPASINCLIMINIILALFLGIRIFKEKHTCMEYNKFI